MGAIQMKQELKVRLYNEILNELKKELAVAEAEVIKYNKLIIKKILYERILNEQNINLDKEYKVLITQVSNDINDLKKEYENWNLKVEMCEIEIEAFTSMMVEQEIIDLESLSDEILFQEF